MMKKEELTDGVVVNQVQLLLAEKRTHLSVLRTGIAVLALPLSIMSVLIATSKYYDPAEVFHLAAILGVFLAGLCVLGLYLITRSIVKMHTYDRHIHQLKLQNSTLRELID